MSEITHTLATAVGPRKVLVAVIAQQMTSDEARTLANAIEKAAEQADVVSPIVIPSGPLPSRAS